MKASDLAYIISLVEQDKAKPELVKELQKIYQTAQGRKYSDVFHVPVTPVLSVWCS